MEEVTEEVQEVPEEVQEVPEEVQQVPEKVQQVPGTVQKAHEKAETTKRSKVIEAPIAEEVPETKEEPKRMGRPAGAKDSKPRRKKVEVGERQDVEADRRTPDPVYNYHEVKRQAVERAYQAQGEHWSNLLAHLM